MRQLLRRSADDIDHSGALALTMNALLRMLLSAPALGIDFGSQRFPTAPGWDQFTGYGRPDAERLLEVTETTIPPEADLSGSLRWFDTVDPVRDQEVRGDRLGRGGAGAGEVPLAPRGRLRRGAARVPAAEEGQVEAAPRGRRAREVEARQRPPRSAASIPRP